MDGFVTSGGVDLAVREFGGDGSPVLLLPGAGNTLVDMAPLASYLVADHRVVGMDLRNHGRSGDGAWNWDALLGDVRVVLDHFTMTRPMLVGHSLGGMLAALYSQRVEQVAAVNLDGFGSGPADQYDMDRAEVERLRRLLDEVTDDAIRSMTQPLPAAQVEAGRQAWVAGARALGFDQALAEEAFDRKLVDAADGTFTTRPDATQLEAIRRSAEQLDMLGMYDELTAPNLVCIATREDAAPGWPDELRALAAARRRAVIRRLRSIAETRSNVQVIEVDATHGLIYECPKLIAEHIRAFAATPDTAAVGVSTHDGVWS
ncbi:MAG: alpha/beta hydrolase [Frankiales bacterium]|nr:alpha/beta hydrolase [Frankiales bacterium]